MTVTASQTPSQTTAGPDSQDRAGPGTGRATPSGPPPRRTAAGGEAGERSAWAALVRWRDWTIPVKLGAVILVPVVFAVVLGALRIGDQVDRADTYRDVDRVVAVTDSLRRVINWVQVERTKSAVLLTGGYGDIAGATAGERQSVDYARQQLRNAVQRADFTSEVTRARYADVVDALGRLDALRTPVAAGSVDSATAIEQYTSVTDALLDFDRAAVEEIADSGLAGTAAALHQLDATQEEIRYQWAQVAVGIARGGLNAADTAALRTSQARLDDHVAAFVSLATAEQRAEYERQLAVPAAQTRADLLRLVLIDPATPADDEDEEEGPAPLPVAAADWDVASDQTSARLSAVGATLGERIKSESDALQNAASDAAGLASVVLILALVLAAAIIVLIGRQLLRSLAELRRGALDVARNRLPAAVAHIRDGGQADIGAVEPIAVPSADEVGQVARAFDAVHEQALRLAGEQAALRANYGNVFVNLSRRSQGLVQRQLHLLERLERDEEDADQLDTLFQLDHLATRMRRNNENLMVLSGSEPGRRTQQPAPLADLLRAAVSEMEQYQRVVIQSPPTVLVVGYAVGDLVRLVAELLDNAAAFSAPTTQVTIASHHTDGGSVRIEVVDRGIGMRDDEFADANRRLADAGTVDASTARRMGLFVVGRLASRHGVQVQLRPGNQSGTRATVLIPADLVTSNVVDLPPVPPKAPAPTTPPGGLPRGTTSPANGSGPTNGSGPATGVNGNGAPGAGRGANGTGRAPNGSGANGRGVNGGHGVNGGGVNGSNGSARGANGTGLLGGTGSRANGAPRHSGPTNDGSNGSAVNGSTNGATANGNRVNGNGANGSAAPTQRPTPPPNPIKPTPFIKSTRPAKPTPPNGSAKPTPPTKADKPATGGLPRRTPAAPRTGGDGARMPEAVPPPREPEAAKPVVDHVPLPRREPRKPAEHPPAPDSGTRLFDPMPAVEQTGWWDTPPVTARTPGAARPVDALHETTPIFDEMISAWFRSVTDDPTSRPEDLRTPPTTGWDFAADRGFSTAQAVAATTPEDFTDTGLPRRTPRRNLVPGSIGQPPAARALPPGAPVGSRDAAELRERLSSYQRGIHRARGAHAPAAPEPVGPDLRGAGWRISADTDPAEVADGGLPRRTPRERLLPGSVDETRAQSGGPLMERDAAALRSRLGSLQRGIGRGRESLARRGGPDDPEPGRGWT
ncbi:putative sensor-like histidine kinase [Actinokineospora spheciospongiae]|uniref:histidine kinase n=1 Tax=Actinokineospora spheciospongiae TaxID=909613 RepID=W7IDH8_9PSEU|nr:nitrate- and nitrite sensing domain-containing protein [Actinokineospora spheciospongiae]EWC58920.1 putative sensor-like histidine kinase [Actinokineospora spheciospongiae]